jgi:hypothetical protein
MKKKKIQSSIHGRPLTTEVTIQNVKGIAQPAFSIYQGLFETPRGILVVPRVETATEDGLAIFEGPPVPLGTFVDETEPNTKRGTTSAILQISIRRTEDE